MSTTNENRFDPSVLSPEDAARLRALLEKEVRAQLITQGGDPILLPEPVNEFFLHILDKMARREVIFLVHEDEALTTQRAADMLGISRQFLVRLLEDNTIPCHKVGSHRRIFFKDLIAYKNARSEKRRAVLDEMTEDLVKHDLDHVYVDLTREEAG